MQIARVRLAGFKSFVDPVELHILPGLTGVVGPNGCGKSNLLEAIRWVMGEGSPKSLRGAAMDDVIFSGTASRPQRQFAEVSILAERGEDEVEVIRRIERGAGSAYRINGREARARDAQLIFADAATGPHSPALVSQGRIGAIIAAKPAERRLMLEEAAGISGLYVRRRDAEIRLRATEANLARVEELVADLDGRMVTLGRQARAAERYRKLSEDIRLAEGRLIYARWRDAAEAADTARAEAKQADEAVFAAAEAQRAATAWSNDAVGKLAAARATAQGARDDAADARHRLATVQAERERVDARLGDLKAQTERLAHDLHREGELGHDAAAAIARLVAEVEALDVRLAQDSVARPARAEALRHAEERSRAAEVALALALAEAARDAAELRVAEAAVASAAKRLARASDAYRHAREALASLPDLEALAAARSRALAAREAADGAARAAVANVEDAERAHAEAAAKRAAAETHVSVAAAEPASLDSEARALEVDLETVAGALLTVRAAPGYEVALAAALADDLNAVVGAHGQRRWTGSDARADDSELPTGEPLAAHVEAPPELQRRLRQIAVVDVDDGVALSIGQRIVTRKGELRRWDGFVSEGAGASVAERLKRRNRLSAIEVLLPGARAASGAAAIARTSAIDTLAQAAARLKISREARQGAEDAHRSSQRSEDQAILALERLSGKLEEATGSVARARDEEALAHDEHRQAAGALSALATARGDDPAIALEREARSMREDAASLRAALTAQDSRLASDRARREAAVAEMTEWRSRGGKAAKRVEDMERWSTALAEEADALASAPDRLNTQSAMIGIEAARLADVAQAALEAERSAEAALRAREEAALKAAEALSTAREVRAGAQARTDNQELRRVEMGRVAGERFECPAALLPEKLNVDVATIGAVSEESRRLEQGALDRERLGPVNLVAATELAELKAGRESSAAEIAELTEAIHRLRGSIGSLNREGRTRLRNAFVAVDGHFRTLFGTLFGGGEAHLSLVDSDDPLDAGLEIMAQPPGKKLSSLTLLSGGEQALTAVALIFALFLTNPAPLCVLDEVDAPLDDANVERFCALLDAMARDTATRYLIVTHNAVTMSRMHRLWGVTMVEQGISRLVSVDLRQAEALLSDE